MIEILRIVLFVIVIVIFFISLYFRIKMRKLAEQIKQEGIDIATRIVYVQTTNKILFKANELSLKTGEIKTMYFSSNEIPKMNSEQMREWLAYNVLDFLATRQWMYQKPISSAEVEKAYNEIKALCMQLTIHEPLVKAITDINWCLQLVNDDNEGTFVIATEKKPKNYLQFEEYLSTLFMTKSV
jgi:hypothetical protein